MGDVTTFGSEPWMEVSSTSSWPTAPSAKRGGDWSTTWTSSSTEKNIRASLPNQVQTVTIPSISNDNSVDKLLVSQLNGLTFIDTMSPNAWTAKPSETKKNKDDKLNIEEELSKQNLYKTELCRSFVDTGACRYGGKCQFAHGAHELRPVLRHPKYKTEICKKFSNTGNCPYGNRCRFIHPGITNTDDSDSSLATSGWSTSWNTSTSVQIPEKKQPNKQQIKALSPESAKRLAIFQHISE